MPRISPSHFFLAFSTDARRDVYIRRTARLRLIASCIISIFCARIITRDGKSTLVENSTPAADLYSSVLPGNPNTIVKSPSLTPLSEILKYFLGL